LDDKEKEMIVYNDRLMNKILKSALYTIITVFCVMYGLGFILDLMFQSGDMTIVVCLLIGIIFTIFYCTLTIIEEIKRIGK
jgi:uncharacterized membrane protein YGL010W